jgi:hypothetical protein
VIKGKGMANRYYSPERPEKVGKSNRTRQKQIDITLQRGPKGSGRVKDKARQFDITHQRHLKGWGEATNTHQRDLKGSGEATNIHQRDLKGSGEAKDKIYQRVYHNTELIR